MLDCDPEMVVAIERARGQRWGHIEELLARQTELQYELLRVMVTANTPKHKRRSWPKYRYPRPGDESQGPKVVTWGQLAARMIGG